MKKVKVHRLTSKNILQRKNRALNFYNLINNRQYEFILTMDEVMLLLNGQNGVRDFVYLPKSRADRARDAPLLSAPPAHPQQRIFASGFSWRSPIRLYVVPKNAKVIADLFIDHI